MKLTGNQIIAKQVLGYVPIGYVCAIERCNSGKRFQIGLICVDGDVICSVPSYLHGGKLPDSQSA